MADIFISYSHEDVEFKVKLEKQLEVLALEGLCTFWEDTQIELGSNWLPGIQNAIDEAKIAILMISANFLISRFIRSEEVPRILKLRQQNGLKVLPLFTKPCAWKKVEWLSNIQGFPSGDKTLFEMDEPQQLRELTNFAEKIHDILKTSIGVNPGLSVVNHLITPLPPRKIELIGRSNELEELQTLLNQKRRVVLVNGLGGIGKTEVCKSFFNIHHKEYEYAAYIEWFGSVKESLVRALGGDTSRFISVSENDTRDERFEKIKVRLGEMTQSMLMVMDNIENPETDGDLEILLALPECIKILANSRYHIEGVVEKCLDFLSENECGELFYRYYKGKPDDEAVKAIVTLCGFHTLTVELLARTADHDGMSLVKLHDTLKSTGFNLNAVTCGRVSTFWHNEKEKKTFFEHLLKVFDVVDLTQREQWVLGNVSVLPAMYILQEWVKEWLKLETNNEIVSLVEKGWLKRDSEYRIFMHPVTGEVVRTKLEPGAEMCRNLIDSLKWKLYKEPGDNPVHKKEFLIYGESVVHFLGEENDADLASLANNVSMINMNIGQLDRALEFQLKTIKIFETVLGENHPDLATSYNNVSMIYKNMGQLDRALEFQLKDIAISEKVLGENHPNLATSYNNLSQIYQDMGQLDRALEFAEKAVAIMEKLFPGGHYLLDLFRENLEAIQEV